MQIKKNTFGEDHPGLAYYFENLGNVYKYQGKLNLAEEHYLKAMQIQINFNGKDHPTITNQIGNLGNIYFN